MTFSYRGSAGKVNPRYAKRPFLGNRFNSFQSLPPSSHSTQVPNLVSMSISSFCPPEHLSQPKEPTTSGEGGGGVRFDATRAALLPPLTFVIRVGSLIASLAARASSRISILPNLTHHARGGSIGGGVPTGRAGYAIRGHLRREFTYCAILACRCTGCWTVGSGGTVFAVVLRLCSFLW